MKKLNKVVLVDKYIQEKVLNGRTKQKGIYV